MITKNTVALPDPNDDDSRRADSNLAGEQRHDGNENGEQRATDSDHNDSTDANCDRCQQLHECLFDNAFTPTCETHGSQMMLFEPEHSEDADEASEAFTDYTGRVYTEADVHKAQYEKYPIVRAWLTQNHNVFRWLESAFLELADVATGPEISGNVLAYHLRYNGIADAEGRRQRRNVAMSNNINPALARVLGILHPDEADKLRMRPSVWDVPALQPQLEELAKVIDEER